MTERATSEPLLPGRGVLAHEWIEPHGGAEKVLDEFVAMAPGADVLCLWDDDPTRFADNRVLESWLASTPLRRRKAAAVPLMGPTWRHRRHRDYDWALVSSYSFAHHLRLEPPGEASTFVYVHSPARYLWAPEDDPRGRGRVRGVAANWLRQADRRHAGRPRFMATNSDFVRERVARSWDRDSVVIYPPVDVERIGSVDSWAEMLDESDLAIFRQLPEDFLLSASRLVPYKCVDTAILAAGRADLPLVVAGSGPDLPRLQAIARSVAVPVIFLGRVSDALLYALYQRTLAYLFLATEDFGIMPVEALAAGGRVVASATGGTRESVADFGALVDRQDLDDVVKGLDQVQHQPRPERDALEQRFGRQRFRRDIRSWMRQELS